MMNLKFFNEKKGITPVIAVVILVMITILLTSMLWYWLQGMINVSMTNDDATFTGEALRIDSITCNSTGITNFSIYNAGSKTVVANTASIYIGITNISYVGQVTPKSYTTVTVYSAGNCTANKEIILRSSGQTVDACTITATGATNLYQFC